MRIGFLSSLSLLLLGAGLALAQAPSSQPTEILEQNSLPANTTNAFDPDCPEPCSYTYASGEFIWWWMTKTPQPTPLVTTAPAGVPAILGSPTTRVLFGGQDFENSERQGGRATIGWCCQEEHRVCLEASLFALGDRSSAFQVSSNSTGDSTLARPVINARTGTETAVFIALQDHFSGALAASAKSSILGAEMDLFCNPFNRLAEYPDLFVGFRYLNLGEELNVGQNTTILNSGVAGFNGNVVGPGNVLALNDHFATLNQFYGTQVGLRYQFDRCCYFLNVLTAVGFGPTVQSDTARGNTTLNPPGGPAVTVPGGLLALRSNSSSGSNTEFSVVPEVRVTVGIYLTSHLQASVGYNFLYWTDVVRPGSDIDRRINSTQLPTSILFGTTVGPAQPTNTFTQKDLILQGFNFGLSYRF